MMQVPLQAIPNQQFQLMVDGNAWDLTVKSIGGVITVSFLLNSVDLYDSARAVAGSFIIPSIYEESGNFIFVTQQEQIPDYTQFGITQYLIYCSPSDMAGFRASPPAIIPAAIFNPIAALPLRFSPQGYVGA